MERKVLQMMFVDAVGKQAVISVANPREDLTMETVRPVGELLVEKPVLESTHGILKVFKGAKTVTTITKDVE